MGGAGGIGELPEVTKRLQGAEEGLVLGLDQAVHLAIDCASECNGYSIRMCSNFLN